MKISKIAGALKKWYLVVIFFLLVRYHVQNEENMKKYIRVAAGTIETVPGESTPILRPMSALGVSILSK
jgi:hypothetical protein